MIYNLQDFIQKRSELRKKSLKLVFTNGCFDIIHKGHVNYLNAARNLGDFLVIGLNSDSSVKILKGNTRPINNENDRAYVLDNLKSVDAVIIFTDDTPYKLIKDIKPDFLVKGGDWKEENIVGSDIVKEYGGKVLSLNFLSNYSTTAILEKIKSN